MSEIDLTPFCDPDSPRYNLSAPFVRKGWKYGTDSRICVRIPTNEPDTVKPTQGGNLPAAYELFAFPFPECCVPLSDHLVRMKSVPTLNANSDVCGCGSSEETTCSACDGSGFKPCTKCDGTGETECSSCGHEEECFDCDGTGNSRDKCATCSGSRIKPGSALCPICTAENPRILCLVGAAAISRAYWLKLRTLPGLRLLPPEREDGRILFTFDGGGQGVLATIVRDYVLDDAEATSAT